MASFRVAATEAHETSSASGRGLTVIWGKGGCRSWSQARTCSVESVGASTAIERCTSSLCTDSKVRRMHNRSWSRGSGMVPMRTRRMVLVSHGAGGAASARLGGGMRLLLAAGLLTHGPLHAGLASVQALLWVQASVLQNCYDYWHLLVGIIGSDTQSPEKSAHEICIKVAFTRTCLFPFLECIEQQLVSKLLPISLPDIPEGLTPFVRLITEVYTAIA